MRKRRRLADKLTIMVCAVLVAVSAFFYAPMEVCADDNDTVLSAGVSDVGRSVSSDEFYSLTGQYYADAEHTYLINPITDFGDYVLSDHYNLIPDTYYQATIDVTVDIELKNDASFFPGTTIMIIGDNRYSLFNEFYFYGKTHSEHNSFTFVFNSSDDLWEFVTTSFVYTPLTYDLGYTIDLSFSLSDFVVLSASDVDDYQNGYNAGYSAGEQAGYGNGYSQGFADGEASVDTDEIYDDAFQAGKDSVDTESYYDAGYEAGYQVAYQEGYESGYDEGLKSARESLGEWQWYKFIGSPVSDVKKYGSSFYIGPYGLDDMEEYQNGSNGYYHNTVPSVYDGYSTINYLIPFDGVTQIDADSFLVEMTLSDVISGFDIDTGSGHFQNSLVSSEVQEVYLTFNGRKYFGNIGKYTSGSHGYVNFSFIVDDVIPPVELKSNCMALTFVVHNNMFANINAGQYKFVGASCSPYVSFNVGSTAQGYAFRVRPFIKNDRVSANIQNQTDQLTGGWNGSAGSSANSDLSFGLNEFETAENSLFASATAGMKDFTFFDIESVPAMLTAVTFITSIMGSWFEQAGGASGVGIVLSILFSVMLVSMVLGLYRLYQSAGHRAEARQRHAENMERWKKGK